MPFKGAMKSKTTFCLPQRPYGVSAQESLFATLEPHKKKQVTEFGEF